MNWLKKNWLHLLAILLIVLAGVWCVFTFIKAGKGYDGTTGDAFNGMAGPVVSLVSAILIYFSFLQQVKANQIQYKALRKTINQNNQLKNHDIIHNKILDVKRQIDLFQVQHPEYPHYSPLGTEAIHTVSEHLNNNLTKNEKVMAIIVGRLDNILYILSVLHEVVYMMHVVKLDKVHRDFLCIELRWLFNKRFFDDLDIIIKYCEKERDIDQNNHPGKKFTYTEEEVIHYKQMNSFLKECKPFVASYYAYQEKYKCPAWYNISTHGESNSN